MNKELKKSTRILKAKTQIKIKNRIVFLLRKMLLMCFLTKDCVSERILDDLRDFILNASWDHKQKVFLIEERFYYTDLLPVVNHNLCLLRLVRIELCSLYLTHLI